MKRIALSIAAIACLMACESNEEKPVNMALLPGTWTVVEHFYGEELMDTYGQVHQGMDMETSEILWSDTIEFGATTLLFSNENIEVSMIRPFEIKSDLVRDLFGMWIIDTENEEIDIYSSVNEYMMQDTVVNEHTYDFVSFVNQSYKVEKLTNTELVLSVGNQVLSLERAEE